MKKIISALLTLSMILSLSITDLSADTGTGQCYHLHADAVYGYFNDFSMNASDSVISFDLAMAANSEGAPVLKLNAGNEIVIGSTSVSLAGQSAQITWGNLETKHWRRVAIAYLNGAATIAIDGTTVLSVASGAVCRTNGITLVGWPGTILLDNLKVSNKAGTIIKYLSFDDEGVYLNSRSNDSTAIRTTVPTGSYSDYNDIGDYPVIFSGADKLTALSPADYSAAQISAKLTYTGSAGGAANAFLNLSSAGLSANDYRYAVITYMTPNKTGEKNSTSAVSAALVGAIGGSEPSESLKVSFPLNTDGRYHAKIVDLSTLSGWTGSVGGIQLRFFESANSGDVMYLDSVILCGSLAKANAAAQARETVKESLGIYDEGTATLGHAEGANYVCNFDSTADLQYVANGNNSAFAYDSAYNALKCTATGADPSVYVNLSKDGVSADVYKYIVYTYRIPTASAVQNPVGNFYYVCGNITVPTAGYESALYPYAKDGDLHYAVIDLSTKANWSGNVKGLRIDYFNEAPSGSIVYIDSVIFCTTADAATAAGNRKLTGTDIHYLGTLENGNYLCNFDSSEDMQHIIGANNSLFSYDSAQNAMKCTVTAASDPNVYVDLKNEGISADVYKYMVCTYKIPTTTQRQNPVGNFYYVCGNITGPTAGYESSVYSYTKDGNLHYKVVDLSAKSNWSGQIKGMRIDYFTDAFIGDITYIDSLVFCKTEADAVAAGNAEIGYTPPVLNPNDAAAVWNKFWQTGTISGNEFIVRSGDSGTDLNLYFRYNSTSALTQSSIADRFEKAIKTATGVDLSAEVYTGFIDIKNAFKTVTNGKSASGNMQFTLTPANGAAYCVRVPVTVILDAACPSDLNGNDKTEPDPTYPNLSQPSALGVTVTDSKASLTSANELAIHSNHEMRVVHTENKTFAVYPTGANTNPTQFEIFEIKADGSAASFYSDSMKRGSSKPNIMLGFDGMVYVFYGEELNGSAQLNAYYFNPAATTYTVTKVSLTKSFSGGNAAGGYGYSQPILDNTTKKAHVIFCGGQNGTGDFAWFSFDQQTKTWENNARHISIGNRHCYVYAYADQKGGVNLVAGRDVRLADIGLAGIVTGAEYAWDELSLFHIPDMYASSYTKSTFAPADYTQTGRSLYPTIQNNTWGDTYLASDGKLHILYQKSMHGTFHHDNKYKEIWHAVYDTAVTGTPQLIYNRPIRFVNEENSYACRLAESTAGDLYILAMPSNMNARVEIWSSADTNDFTFRFDSAKTFSTAEASGHSILITGPRNGSVKDNILDCMYPTGSGTATYRYFKVTLP